MISTAKDIVSILGGETALALTPGTDLFFGRMPDEPDACVAVLDVPGGTPMLTMKQDTSNYFYTGVSVQARATKYADAWNQVFAIMEFLHAASNITVAFTYYALIRAEADPQLLEYDQHERPVIFVNFEVQRRSVAFGPWQDIDMDVFTLQGQLGFDGQAFGAGGYSGNAKFSPQFTLGDGEAMQVTLDEVFGFATQGSIAIQLYSVAAGVLDSGSITTNVDDQVFTLTNNDGQAYSDLEIRIELSGFGQTTDTEIRNTRMEFL